MNDLDERRQRLDQLRAEHRELDDRIAGMTITSAFDQIELQRLKKRKLRLKDEIACLENDILPDIIA